MPGGMSAKGWQYQATDRGHRAATLASRLSLNGLPGGRLFADSRSEEEAALAVLRIQPNNSGRGDFFLKVGPPKTLSCPKPTF